MCPQALDLSTMRVVNLPRGIYQQMGSSQQEKQVVHPPAIMTKTSGDITIPKESRQQPSQQRAQSFMIVNLSGNNQSTAEVEEIETTLRQSTEDDVVTSKSSIKPTHH